MTKWNDSFKKDLQKVTMSSNVKAKIIQRQPLKQKTSNLRPIIASSVLLVIMCLVLIQTATQFLTINKTASITDFENQFSELYIERVEDGNITMHRSSLYNGIASIDEEGRTNFSQIWQHKKEANINADYTFTRQFLAYDQEGNEISGVLLFDVEDEKLYVEVDDKQYDLFITNEAFEQSLGFSELNYAFYIIFLLIGCFALFFDWFYESKSKQKKIISTIAVLLFMFGDNSNIYLPLLMFLFIALAIWIILVRGEKIHRHRKILFVSYFHIIFSLISFIVISYFIDLTITQIVLIMGVAFLAMYVSESRLKKNEPVTCPHCEKELPLLFVIRNNLRLHQNQSHCKHCGEEVHIDKLKLFTKESFILLLMFALIFVGELIGLPAYIIYPLGIINILMVIFVQLATTKLEKVEKSMW